MSNKEKKDEQPTEAGMDTKPLVSSSVFDWLRTEVTAGKLMFPPDDEYKAGWNAAMDKCLGIIKRYKEGNGLFQQ